MLVSGTGRGIDIGKTRPAGRGEGSSLPGPSVPQPLSSAHSAADVSPQMATQPGGGNSSKYRGSRLATLAILNSLSRYLRPVDQDFHVPFAAFTLY